MLGTAASAMALSACTQSQPAAPAAAPTSAPAAPAATSAPAAAAPTAAQAAPGGQKKFAGQTLRIQYWAGPEGDNITKNVTDPFKEETGAEVVVDYGHTSDGIARIQAQKADPLLDIVCMDDIGPYTLQPEGVLQKLDPAKIPNLKDLDPQFLLAEGTGAAFFTYADTIIYNTDIYKEMPESYEVMWAEENKGRVALPPSNQMPSMKLSILAARMNGGGQDNIEPGFEKLALLKPNVHSFLEDTATAGEAMKTGDIAIMFYVPYIYKDQMAKGYPIAANYLAKEGTFVTGATAAIPLNHPGSQELAELWINRALSAEAQLGMAEFLWFGPTNTKVKIDSADLKKNLLTSENFENIIPVDIPALFKVRPDWIKRYDAAVKE